VLQVKHNWCRALIGQHHRAVCGVIGVHCWEHEAVGVDRRTWNERLKVRRKRMSWNSVSTSQTLSIVVFITLTTWPPSC